MTVKDWLRQYIAFNNEIDRLSERIQTVKNELEGICAVIIDDMPKGHSYQDNTAYLIDLKTSLIAEYKSKQANCP